MTYPEPQKLYWPIEPYKIGGYGWRERVRRKIILWATHLGDDVEAAAGTEVKAIGDGEVVWSEMRAGSEKKRNWGGLIVVAHSDKAPAPITSVVSKALPDSDGKTSNFYSLYGHLEDLRVNVGDQVVGGQVLGVVAGALTPENGWWKTPHLHFGIYVGPWRDVVLPGYKRMEEWRTRTKWWRDPSGFIEQYNKN